MKILILTFYYTPDLCAGSFRANSLVQSLLKAASEKPSHIEIITTLPNRYSTFHEDAQSLEEGNGYTIHRVKLPSHKSGMVDQSKAFITYTKFVLDTIKEKNYDLIFGTSSRLMTAALSAYVAKKSQTPLYLDIRDIFVDTLKDILPRRISFFLSPFFSAVEKWAFTKAIKINLVSEGFREYIEKRYPNTSLSFFTNGIDPVFLSESEIKKSHTTEENTSKTIKILYAGNIGEGQGLHRIIPYMANNLNSNFLIEIIGDGGKKEALLSKIKKESCENVLLSPPVKQKFLLSRYIDADILFLHLNDHSAFKKVLPSKIFEYAATGKPILAGVSGYAKNFIEHEISNAAVFQPCNVEDSIYALNQLNIETKERKDFKSKFSRKRIMASFANDIIETASGAKV